MRFLIYGSSMKPPEMIDGIYLQQQRSEEAALLLFRVFFSFLSGLF